MANSSGSLARKALGWLVVAFVAIFVIKLALGVVFGFLQFLFAIALVLLIGYAVVWAVRRL
jgi:uncharacterized BrkB/YihY/UPF0761 family membrane protein